jgi:hypothetical protein
MAAATQTPWWTWTWPALAWAPKTCAIIFSRMAGRHHHPRCIVWHQACPARQFTSATPATQTAMPTSPTGPSRSSNISQAISAVTGGVR